MGRSPCCEKMGLKKGPWTPEEDQILINFIRLHGHPNWRALPKQAGLLRCGKSCRLRWTNYLRPDIKRGNFTPDEEDAIIQLHQQLGNRWSAIAARLPGRTDNEIKNVWHTHLKKRLPQANQSPTDQSTTRKRARKQKPSKKGSVAEASKMDHVNSMQQEDENKGNNNGHEDSDVTSNIHASNSLPTNPDIMTSQPLSPQTCTSSSEMSTVTSSSEAYNYDNNGSKEIMIDEGDYFGDLLQMDNDFWTDVLPCIDEDATISTQGDRPMANVYEPCYFDGSLDTAVSTQDYHLGANVSEPYYSNGPLEYSTTELQCLELMNSATEAYQEDMDFFWYHLLIKSNDLTELAQVL